MKLGTTHLYAPYGVPEVTITSSWLANITVAAVFTTIGTAVVVLRILNATVRGRPTGKDDIAMYVAYCSSVHYTIASIVALRFGVGLRKEEIPQDWAVEALKATYAVEIFYFFAIFMVKVSILCMYLRLSEGLGKDHILSKGTIWMLALLTLHFATTIVVAGLQCIPMSKFWSPSGRQLGDAGGGGSGHCISIEAFFYSTNVFNIITDLLILALPVSTFWRMQFQTRRTRLGVISVFAVGLLGTIASCARLYSVKIFANTEKGLENAAPINTWSFIEIYLGMFCASVPAIKTFFAHPRTRTPRLMPSEATPSNTLRASNPFDTDPSSEDPPPLPKNMRHEFFNHAGGHIAMSDLPRWRQRQLQQSYSYPSQRTTESSLMTAMDVIREPGAQRQDI